MQDLLTLGFNEGKYGGSYNSVFNCISVLMDRLYLFKGNYIVQVYHFFKMNIRLFLGSWILYFCILLTRLNYHQIQRVNVGALAACMSAEPWQYTQREYGFMKQINFLKFKYEVPLKEGYWFSGSKFMDQTPRIDTWPRNDTWPHSDTFVKQARHFIVNPLSFPHIISKNYKGLTHACYYPCELRHKADINHCQPF